MLPPGRRGVLRGCGRDEGEWDSEDAMDEGGGEMTKPPEKSDEAMMVGGRGRSE